MKNIAVSTYLLSVMDCISVGDFVPVATTPDICSMVEIYNAEYNEKPETYIRPVCQGSYVTLSRYTLESEADDTIETDYMQTVNMLDDEEIEQWESDNFGAVVFSDSGGRVELCKSEWFHTDKDLKPTTKMGQKLLHFAACDCECETEICLTFTTSKQVRKLRNFLNDYLENHGTY